MKKLHKLGLFSIATALVGFTAIAGLNKTIANDETPLVTKASESDSNQTYGTDLIWFYCISDGTNMFSGQDTRKFIYNYETECYEFTYVLYDGDVFIPYVYPKGYVNWTAAYPLATEKFEANYVGRYTTNTSYFQVHKTGTYKISLDKNVAQDMSSTWQYIEKSYVEYVSDSTELYEPTGTEDIYLYGTFDGTASYNVAQSRKFKYNSETKAYELTYAMYQGDIFVPYMAAPKYKYIPYSYDSYAIEQYNENYVGAYQLSAGTTYFLCQKDGTYKISINYRVEYLYSAADAWKKSNESYIEYISSETDTYTPTGTEDIYLYVTLMERLPIVRFNQENLNIILKQKPMN